MCSNVIIRHYLQNVAIEYIQNEKTKSLVS